MLIGEVLIYPLTISSLFDLLQNILRAKNTNNPININGIVLFVWQTLATIFNVYIFRTGVFIGIIIAVQLKRKNGPVQKTATSLHRWFFVHVVGQMLVQFLMIVCIGAKMWHENKKFGTDGHKMIQISPFLWYMIVSGLVLPLIGIFTFGIAFYYSVQEYPIGFCFDLLATVAEKRDLSDDDLTKAYESVKTIGIKDFNEIRNASFLNRYGYAFQSPLLVALSIAYALPLLAFAVCCMQIETDPKFEESHLIILTGSPGWIAFFVVGVFVVNLMNLPVLLVAGLWIAIILGIIYLIIFFNVFLVLLCFIAVSCYKSTH